jgi:hypothetical protein
MAQYSNILFSKLHVLRGVLSVESAVGTLANG